MYSSSSHCFLTITHAYIDILHAHLSHYAPPLLLLSFASRGAVLVPQEPDQGQEAEGDLRRDGGRHPTRPRVVEGRGQAGAPKDHVGHPGSPDRRVHVPVGHLVLGDHSRWQLQLRGLQRGGQLLKIR